MFTANCTGYKASDEKRHGNYRRRFGSKWLWFILKLHFAIIMEEMRKTKAHFNQKGSCSVEIRFGFLLNNIRWQTVMDRQRWQVMTDAGYLTAGIYSEFNRRSVCRSESNAAPFSQGSPLKMAPITQLVYSLGSLK